MNTSNNIHAFMKAEKAKKAGMSVEQACKAKNLPKGALVVKKPKPAVLKTKPATFAPLVNGFTRPYWVVYFFSAGSACGELGPVEAYNRYHDCRADARHQAWALNKAAKVQGIYQEDVKFRVARVTVSVKYTP